VLPSLLLRLISDINFPKTMRWSKEGTRFARPLQWILAVYDRKVVPFRYAGLSSGNRSRGHRLMAPAAFVVRDFKSYMSLCRKHGVIVDPEERTRWIERDLTRLARTQKGSYVGDETLLDQSVYTTEYPVAL
jgi:glycyl-tRNA synthetase beta chain